MTDKITIPDEALEAAARDVYAEHPIQVLTSHDEWETIPWDEAPKDKKDWCYRIARAACLAMLEAWPSGAVHAPVRRWEPRPSFTLPAIILPLSQEPEV